MRISFKEVSAARMENALNYRDTSRAVDALKAIGLWGRDWELHGPSSVFCF